MTEQANNTGGNNKVMAILCYIGILWLIPLLTDAKNDSFVKFHINQGIILSIAYVVMMIIGFIPVVGFISFIGYIALFVFFIMGIMNAINLQEKPLPLIGNLFTFIK